jgi:hypothetical protein
MRLGWAFPSRRRLDGFSSDLTENGCCREPRTAFSCAQKAAGKRPAFPCISKRLRKKPRSNAQQAAFHPSGNGLNGQARALSLAARGGALKVGK